MQAGNSRGAVELAADANPGRRWQDVVLAAQQDLADTLADAIGDGRLNRHSYQHWLATESAVCRINAIALDALADWHVSLPQLRGTAHAWATAMRDHALAAAADVRQIDGVAAATPSQFGLWQLFLQSASQSSRAGEALGAVVLHAQLLRGPMRGAIAAVTALPAIPAEGTRYLLRRAQPDSAGDARERDALLDVYSGAALAAGAHRAATWYHAALATVLAPARASLSGAATS